MKTCTGAHLLTALVREGDRRDPESAPHQVVVHTPVEQFLLMRQDVHLSKFFFSKRVQDNQDGDHLLLVAVPASPALRHMPLSLHCSQGRHLNKNIAHKDKKENRVKDAI